MVKKAGGNDDVCNGQILPIPELLKQTTNKVFVVFPLMT